MLSKWQGLGDREVLPPKGRVCACPQNLEWLVRARGAVYKSPSYKKNRFWAKETTVAPTCWSANHPNKSWGLKGDFPPDARLHQQALLSLVWCLRVHRKTLAELCWRHNKNARGRPYRCVVFLHLHSHYTCVVVAIEISAYYHHGSWILLRLLFFCYPGNWSVMFVPCNFWLSNIIVIC